MDSFEDWLNRNVETEAYRNRVRSVALGLGDLCACELEDLEEELNLASWPGLAKKRFLKAWRALKAAPGPQPAALPPAEAAAAPAGTPSPWSTRERATGRRRRTKRARRLIRAVD